MRSVRIEVGDSTLHAYRWDGGPALAFAFHGYSNNAGLWSPMAPLLQKTHTLISVDLPHHGGSRWATGTTLNRAAFTAALQGLMKAHGAPRMDLLGFSLGGRACLCTLQDLGREVGRVVMAAPDGLAPNPLYHFVTRTSLGRNMFHRFVNKPQGYIRLLDFIHSRGWINASRHRFMMHHISSEPARRFLEGAWPSLREMVPDLQKVRTAIMVNKTPVHLFMGKHDSVIPLAHGQKFSQGAGDTVHLHAVDRGHHLMDGEIMRRMAAALSDR